MSTIMTLEQRQDFVRFANEAEGKASNDVTAQSFLGN